MVTGKLRLDTSRRAKFNETGAPLLGSQKKCRDCRILLAATSSMMKSSRRVKCLGMEHHRIVQSQWSLIWQVMYITYVTEKAKKYHDGFLKLTIFLSL